MEKQYFLVFVFFHKISLVYLFIHMCNVYAVLLYSFQSYRMNLTIEFFFFSSQRFYLLFFFKISLSSHRLLISAKTRKFGVERIFMCNVYAVLLYSFQSYRSTISEYVFCPGTPQTTNTNTVSKLYSVFIG
jgi:hypothetical protein